jgi:hypothetical protein
MVLNVQARFVLASSKEATIGLRLDRILSFNYSEADAVLIIRYIDDPIPDKFQGPTAEAILREFRFASQP